MEAKKWRMRPHLVVPLMLSLSGCMAGPIPFIGFDRNGHLFERGISKASYEQSLQEGVDGVQDALIPTMEGSPIRDKLSEIRVGLAVKGQFGLGDYLSIEGNVGFRLCFEKVGGEL